MKKCFGDIELGIGVKDLGQYLNNTPEAEAKKLQKDLETALHAMQTKLVVLRQRIQHLHVIEDHVHNNVKDLLQAVKNEPESEQKLKAKVEESYRPVQAKIISKLDKLYRALYELKGAYGITESLIEQASPKQIILAYKDLTDWISTSQQSTDVSMEDDLTEMIHDLSVVMPDIAKLVLLPDNEGSKILSLRVPVPSVMMVSQVVRATDGWPKLKFKISCAGEKPGQFRFPVNATFIPSGGFMVCDKNNHRIQIFDDQGRFIRFLQRRRIKPRRAKVNPVDGLVYVSDERTESVRVVTIDDQRVGSIGDKYFCCAAGLAFDTKGNLVMSDAEKATITMYSPSGKMLGKFCCGYFERRTPCPYFVACNSKDHFIISDCRNNSVKAFTSEGREMFRISDLKCPRGICVDCHDNILVAEGDGHCISVYSMFGKFLRYLLTKEDGLRYPMSVDMNSFGQILVTQFGFFHQEVLMFQIGNVKNKGKNKHGIL